MKTSTDASETVSRDESMHTNGEVVVGPCSVNFLNQILTKSAQKIESNLSKNDASLDLSKLNKLVFCERILIDYNNPSAQSIDCLKSIRSD